MSNSTKRSSAPDTSEGLDLTRQIKKLSLPADASDTWTDPDIDRFCALLICRDRDSKKWGPRWLKQAGLNAILRSDPEIALDDVVSIKPDVIVVEAGLLDADGKPFYSQLSQSQIFHAPVIALCSGTKEMYAALGANVFDIVRKPYEWQLIGLRALHAAEIRNTNTNLDSAQESLAQAVHVADLARQQLRSRETFEPVTGLPNKAKFIDLLKRGMMAVERDNNVLAVMVVGFNRFRLVIEAMGQERADLVMTEVGKVVSECLHEAESMHSQPKGLRTAAAASIEHAKFGLMFTCSKEHDAVTQVQQQVLQRLSQPVQVSGQVVHLSACVGVALYPQDANDVDQLLQRADNAMRDAQSRGGGFTFYCDQTDAAAARKLKLENMLHEALDRHELVVTYQPISNTESGEISGAEALLRWQQPDKKFISPEEFVPIAEDSGLMIKIGEFVLDEACQQMERWRNDNLKIEHICVNVSRAQLVSGGFVQTVSRVLSQYEIDPGSLELELSERGVLSGQFDVLNQLHELKQLGVRLSIDDFGTGDSAIAYLRELPVDSLKIDRSYVEGLTTNPKDKALISAMVALAHNLELKVIAEGVETAQQAEMLKSLGCDEFQGFYSSAAVSGDAFSVLLRKSKS